MEKANYSLKNSTYIFDSVVESRNLALKIEEIKLANTLDTDKAHANFEQKALQISGHG